jgi:hypothetical protein
MTNRELVEKAIRYQLLNELFSEALSDLQQSTIVIKSERDLDLSKLIKRLATDDLLITNAEYAKEKRDFMVLDAAGDIVVTVSPDGRSLNSQQFEYYLSDPSELNKLLRLYERVVSSSKAYTVELAE